MSTTAKEVEGLSYLELKTLLENKKEMEIDKVTKELTAAEGIVEALKAQLSNLGVPVSAPVKRGRKPNAFKRVAKAGKTGKKGKRGAVGAAIREFVSGKGKAGAHISDIAKHLRTKPANVTAFFYAKGNKKTFKKVAPATFAATGKE